MELLLLFVFSYPVQNRTVVDTDLLQQRRQVLQVEVAVRAPMRLTGTRRVFCQDLLTAERTVTAASPVGVAAHIAIDVPDVVPVLLVEGIIGNLVEGRAPEHQTLLERKADTLQEERVL